MASSAARSTKLIAQLRDPGATGARGANGRESAYIDEHNRLLRRKSLASTQWRFPPAANCFAPVEKTAGQMLAVVRSPAEGRAWMAICTVPRPFRGQD